MKIICFVLAISVCLLSCDIPGIIYVKNKSGSDANLLIQKMEPEDNLEISNLESGEDYYFNFGFGNFWNDERVTEFISDIEKLEIQSKNDTLTITDKGELGSFLKSNRGGIFNRQVKILIR